LTATDKPLIYQTVVAKGMVDTNCYLLACPDTREAMIIDPGAFSPGEVKTILGLISQHDLKPRYILNTHGHIDHIAGNEQLKKTTGAELLVHSRDAVMIESGNMNGSFMFGQNVVSPPADRQLKDGEQIELGKLTIKVLHTPGHTPGCICLYVGGTLFSGDTLFAGSIGRTDLPGGDVTEMIRSIKEKLMTMPDETIVRPGHGPRTTIGREREENPFL
jgi:glyoxylase-like metal-dependent hydrolase (beta-lactamase superfamily II)